jgi:hypothetical protein
LLLLKITFVYLQCFAQREFVEFVEVRSGVPNGFTLNQFGQFQQAAYTILAWKLEQSTSAR